MPLFDIENVAATGLQGWQPANWAVAADWEPVVRPFFASAAGRQLGQFVGSAVAQGTVVYPPQPLRALELTPLAGVRVVVLGQDPYHGPGQAEGLAFSVAQGVRIPPSLRNILQEVQRDLGAAMPADGSLVRWARQGVLLLNTCLTVAEGAPGSHARQGWEVLTDAVVEAVARRPEPAVFLLWGAHAQAKQGLVDAAGGGRHPVLMANHPSPLAARRPPVPFVGCGHFSRANTHLVAGGYAPIVW